jgi:hypothetical protein
LFRYKSYHRERKIDFLNGIILFLCSFVGFISLYLFLGANSKWTWCPFGLMFIGIMHAICIVSMEEERLDFEEKWQ